MKKIYTVLVYFSLAIFIDCLGINIGGGKGDIPIGTDALEIRFKSPHNTNEVSAEVNEKIKIIAEVSPPNFINGPIIWNSGDSTVAIVNDLGEVLFREEGSVIISAQVGDKNVRVRFIVQTKIEITKFEIIGLNNLLVGQVLQLYSVLEPQEIKNKAVTWSSSDLSIAFVDENGLVRAHSPGVVSISASVANDTIRAVLELDVQNMFVPATSVVLKDSVLEKVFIDPGIFVEVTIEPAHYNGGAIVWTSSRESVAIIDSKGYLIFKNRGVTQIVVRVGAVSDTIIVTVSGSILKGIRTSSNVEVSRGGFTELNVFPIPEDAIISSVTYSSLDETKATVDSEGIVLGIAEGSVGIVVMVREFLDTLLLNVGNVPLEMIKILGDIVVSKGSFITLTTQPVPIFAALDSIIWSSLDPNIASVNDGNIFGISEGIVSIQALSTSNSAVFGRIQITVEDGSRVADSIRLLDQEISAKVGDSNRSLSAKIFPSYHTEGAIVWRSSNVKVLRVSSLGVLEFIDVGSANVIATIGSVSDTVEITVDAAKITKITIIGNTSVAVGDVIQYEVTIDPIFATNKMITWYVSNPSKASITETGLITGIEIGIVTVKAVSNDGSGKKDSLEIEILTDQIVITSIEIDNRDIVRELGDPSLTMTANIIPTQHTGGNIMWTTSDVNVITISQTGVLYFVSVGSANVIATVGMIADTVSVRVDTSRQATSIAILGEVNFGGSMVLFDLPQIFTKVGDKDFKLISKIVPEVHTSGSVVWTTSNSNVVNVSDIGVLTFNQVGFADIIANIGFRWDTLKVTVDPSVKVLDIQILGGDYVSVGQVFQYGVDIVPTSVADKTVTWFVSNSNKARITETGLVTGISPGTVTIKAVANDGSGVESTLEIVIISDDISATSITLDIDRIIGKKAGDIVVYLQEMVIPIDHTDGGVQWSTSNFDVATVSDVGVITFVDAGTTNIIASIGSISDTVIVIVDSTKITEIKLLGPTNVVLIAESEQYNINILPLLSTNKTVTWSVSNEAKAMINQMGVVEFLALGNVTIKVRTNDGSGLEDSLEVSIIDDEISATSIVLDAQSLAKRVDDPSVTLMATVVPANHTDGIVSWTSSNPSVVNVSPLGAFSFIQVGVANIVATVGLLSDTTVVSVDYAEVIEIMEIQILGGEITSVDQLPILTGISEISVKIGNNSYALITEATPINHTNGLVIWKASDPRVARVNGLGVLEFIGVGITNITAKIGSLVDTLKVTILPTKVTKIDIIGGENVVVSSTEAYITSILPFFATDKSVLWSISDETKASITQEGLLRAILPGVVVIKAVTNDGSKIQGTKSVTIVLNSSPAERIVINPNSLTKEIRDSSEVMIAVISPVDHTDGVVLWTTVDSEIVTVSLSGIVSFVKVGATKLIASVGSISDTINIIIRETPVTDLEILGGLNIAIGILTEYEVSISPLLATNKMLTWSTSDETKARITQEGIVEGLSVGNVTIKVVADDGSNVQNSLNIRIVAELLSASSIIVNPDSYLERDIGDTLITRFTVYPLSHTDGIETWTTSNSEVAVVSQSGVIVFVGVGSADIVATINSFTDTVKVSVLPILVTEITVLGNTNVVDGDDVQLSVDVLSLLATNNTVSWFTSDATKAMVNENGLVSAISPGIIFIKAIANDGSNVQDSIQITITSIPRIVSIRVEESLTTVATGETISLQASVEARGGADESLRWVSISPGKATVDFITGVVEGISRGEVIIIVKSVFDKTKAATITIYVTPAPAILSVMFPSIESVVEDESLSFFDKVIIESEGGASEEVTWVSLDVEKARVNSVTGVVTGVLRGEVEIVVRSVFDGTKVDTLTLTVTARPAVLSIALPSAATVMEDQMITLPTPMVSVEGGASEEVIWSSREENKATVNPVTGVVTGVLRGSVQIVATSKFDDAKATSINVTVTPRPAVLSLFVVSTPEDSVPIGADISFNVYVTTEANASEAVIWSSSDVNKLEISSSSGVGSVLARGLVDITARSTFDSTKFATITIKVTPVPAILLITLPVVDAIVEDQVIILSASVESEGGAPEALFWISLDINIAIIDSRTGMVTGISRGDARIVVKSIFDPTKADTLMLTVTPRPGVLLIALPFGDTTVVEDQTFIISSPTISVEGGASEEVMLISLNTQKATVDSRTGIVTGVSRGVVGIVVKSVFDPTKADTLMLTVTPRPAVLVVDIVLDTIILTVGSVHLVAVNVDTEGGASSDVAFSTLNPDKITILGARLIGKTIGTAMLTVVSVLDRTKKDSVIVIVKASIEEVIISVLLPVVELDSTITLLVDVSVSEGSSGDKDEIVNWESLNANVATVNSMGVVTGVAEGDVIIVATSQSDVTKADSVRIYVQLLIVSPKFTTMGQNKSLNLMTTEECTWNIDNDNIGIILSIASDGRRATVISLNMVGTFNVTATSVDDVTKTGTSIIRVE